MRNYVQERLRSVQLSEAWRMENGLEPRYRIQDLQSGMCRWITCEQSFDQEYCGRGNFKGSSWCEEHWKVCYTKKKKENPSLECRVTDDKAVLFAHSPTVVRFGLSRKFIEPEQDNRLQVGKTIRGD
jgi:hypothetical protein